MAGLGSTHVIVDSMPASGGGLTDAQLRATPVPVSGTVATGGLTDAQLRASAVPVSLASTTITGAVAVTGTFFQVTQPVSLATNTPDVTDRAARLVGHVTVDNASLAVTGTFFQATQPVSLATNTPDVTDRAGRLVGVITAANLDVALSTRLKPADTLTAVTTVTTITNPVTVTPPTLTKGTQGTTGFSTQDLKDAGRNARIFMLDAFVAAPLVEAVQSVVQWYSNAAVGATTQPAVVPAGKTLRLVSWKIMYQSLATAGCAVVRVRVNTAGLGVLGSPLVFSFEAGSAAAVAGVMTTATGDFPEGLEIPAAAGLAFSMAGYGPTGTLTLEGTTRFMVTGYEY